MKGQVLGYLFSKLFRRRIIESNHIRFDETIRFREDDVFMLEYAQHINRWAATDKSNYIYYVPSAKKKYGSSATDCTEIVFDSLYKIFSEKIVNYAWSEQIMTENHRAGRFFLHYPSGEKSTNNPADACYFPAFRVYCVIDYETREDGWTCPLLM